MFAAFTVAGFTFLDAPAIPASPEALAAGEITQPRLLAAAAAVTAMFFIRLADSCRRFDRIAFFHKLIAFVSGVKFLIRDA
ncbi:MAG: hypothetical protein Fur0044_11750 [Anaerolineae bacterium]